MEKLFIKCIFNHKLFKLKLFSNVFNIFIWPVRAPLEEKENLSNVRGIFWGRSSWFPWRNKVYFLCSSPLDPPCGSTFIEVKMALEKLLLGQGYPAKSHVLPTTSWEMRKERQELGCSLPYTGLPSIYPGLPAVYRQGAAAPVLSPQFPNGPAPGMGKAAGRILISSTLKELPHQILHEHQKKEWATMYWTRTSLIPCYGTNCNLRTDMCLPWSGS